MSKIDEILADVPIEGSDPFKDVVKETPSDSPAEKEPEKEEPKEGDNTPTDENVPFHKHPRWIEREQELTKLRELEETHAHEIAELKGFKDSVISEEKAEGIPDWFRELYGDNQVAYSKYQQHEQARTEQIEQTILQKQEETRLKEAQEAKYWEGWVDTEITKLQSEGKTFDRNKLIKYMLDYSPTTGDSYDFQKGYAIYEALEGKDTSHSDARKALADTTTRSSKGESKAKDYMTPADLRNKSMMSL